MECVVRHVANSKLEAVVRGHRLVTDQPVEKGGGNAGPTPPELFLASLGSCAAYYAAEYLLRRDLPAGEMSVHVTAEKRARPERLDAFRIQVTVPGVGDRHRQGVLRAVRACLIHNTLVGLPSVAVEVVPADQRLVPRGPTAVAVLQ